MSVLSEHDEFKKKKKIVDLPSELDSFPITAEKMTYFVGVFFILFYHYDIITQCVVLAYKTVTVAEDDGGDHDCVPSRTVK